MGKCFTKHKEDPGELNSVFGKQSSSFKPSPLYSKLVNIYQKKPNLVKALASKITVQGKLSDKSQKPFESKNMDIQGNLTESTLHLLGVSVVCKKGLKDAPNQDDYCIVLDKSSLLLGIFDGHGPFGHQVSSFVQKALTLSVLSNPKLGDSPLEVIKNAYAECQRSLKAQFSDSSANFDCFLSGTTATLLYFESQKLYISHVGDSRAILAKRKGKKLKAFPLTTDHKPQNSQEKLRIQNSGGEVIRFPYDVPYRVCYPGQYMPGLSLSRALGDFVAHDLGVCCKPDLKVVELTEQDEFVVVASDGVWEFISDQEAVDKVSKYSSVKTAANKLANLAWNKWIKHEKDLVDDITVIVVSFTKVC